jgi:hypothetical protein
MMMRPLVPVSVLTALLVSMIATTAAAQEPPAAPPAPAAAPAGPAPVLMMPLPPPPRDGVRFRGGVALEGGALIVPGIFSVGIAGVQGTMGVQINNLVGVYAVPSFDIVFGSVGGLNLGAAFMVDFTLLDDAITVGGGPDVDLFAAFGGGSGSLTAVGGALYGARLHFGWNAVVSREESRARRKALTIGADVRLLGGGAGFATTTSTTASAGGGTFVLAPMLTVGYTAF